MPRVLIAIAALIVAATLVAPAGAESPKPRIVSLDVSQEGAQVKLVVVGRDPDGAVNGTEIAWGEGGPGQGLSSCAADGKRRRGKRERFRLSYVFPEPGTYAISVRVSSGGCGGRPAQWSKRRRLTLAVG